MILYNYINTIFQMRYSIDFIQLYKTKYYFTLLLTKKFKFYNNKFYNRFSLLLLQVPLLLSGSDSPVPLSETVPEEPPELHLFASAGPEEHSHKQPGCLVQVQIW